MGGGSDSRIPRLLRDRFAGTDVSVVVRTYDFDPETGRKQILSWVEELEPVLVIGESLGAIQALRVRGIPHLFVSPSLGAPMFLYRVAWITRIPGGSALLHRIWPVKEGDRQPLRFEYDILRKYKAHWEDALKAVSEGGSYYAFFGRKECYARGIRIFNAGPEDAGRLGRHALGWRLQPPSPFPFHPVHLPV